MKLIRGVVPAIIAASVLGGCFDPPEFPVEPRIEFERIEFKDQPDPSADSLILTISFQDGDGDLGLFADEVDCYLVGSDTLCFNDKFYFVNQNGKLKKLFEGVEGDIVNYAMKRTNPDFAYLPDFVAPYNCTNWEVRREDGVVVDTLYFELNPNHYNIFIEFYVKQNDSSFELFDPMKEIPYPSCGGTYNGRFPVLPKDLSTASPLEGTIRYVMQSTAFLLQFSVKTLKIRVRIQDRLLNSSNSIETPEFTLQSIKS